MRRGEIITAFILGIFSVYLMWKSGEPPAWNPDVPRFANIGYDESGTPGSGFWPFWLGVIMLASCIWTGVSWAHTEYRLVSQSKSFLLIASGIARVSVW